MSEPRASVAEAAASALRVSEVVIDCADHGRAGDKVKALYPAPLACFDHHVSNVGFAKRNFVDTASAATAEVLAGLFFDAGLPVDATSARLADGTLAGSILSLDEALRNRLRSEYKEGAVLRFYGELGQYRERWQFVIQDASWVK